MAYRPGGFLNTMVLPSGDHAGLDPSSSVSSVNPVPSDLIFEMPLPSPNTISPPSGLQPIPSESVTASPSTRNAPPSASIT